MDEFKKADGETFDEYMMRIGEACSERKLTQNQAAELLNEATGSDYGECRYRKTYKSWKDGYDYAIDHANEETIKNELQRLKIEKIKLQDERNATNKVYRDVARAESVKELILKNVAPYNPDNFLNVVQYEDSGHDVIVCLSDLHAGAGIDSAWNKFNKDILRLGLRVMLHRCSISQRDIQPKKFMCCCWAT